MSIENIEDPEERFIAFIEEREAIRVRRENKLPWPWTHEGILKTYRFTNIHREDDAVSQHYQKTIRNHYGIDPLVFPATMLYRWFNRISTCNDFFNQPDFNNQSVFEQYMDSHDFNILLECLNKIPPPHVTGAFIITGLQGYAKGEGVLRYFDIWFRAKPSYEMWELWLDNPPLLNDIYLWIRKDAQGLGTFMAAQIVADLKYLPFLRNAKDWWTWAAPGPGSMKGLNIVLGRDMETAWREDDWLAALTRLNDRVMPKLAEIGIDRLHNQDLQNCLCEFSKFEKVRLGLGRPRQVFRHEGVKNV